MKNNTAIILILLSIGLFYTFTNVQYQKVKESHALASQYQNVLQNASDIVELKDQLLVTYEAFPKIEIDRINKMLPDNIDTVRLALDLDGIASRHGIAIKSVQVITKAEDNVMAVVLPENEGTYERATVSFGFISSYENFRSLLSDIEKNLRIMDVKSITFQTGESNLYEFQMSADTYWLK